MDATSVPEQEAEEFGQKAGLTAKGVKRRMARISTITDPKKANRQTNRLAVNLLEKIAAGEVKNPRAVAKAFLAGRAAPGVAEEEAAD